MEEAKFCKFIHDLNNALMVIQGNSEILLESDKIPDDLIHNLKSIENCCQKIKYSMKTNLSEITIKDMNGG